MAMLRNVAFMFCLAFLLTPLAVALGPEAGCEKLQSTAEKSQCLEQTLRAAEAEMNAALQSALSGYLPTAENEKDTGFPKRLQELFRNADKRTVQSLKVSQIKWLAYRESACSAIESMYEGATIVAEAVPACKLELTEQRTAWLRSHFGNGGTAPEVRRIDPNSPSH